MMSGLGIPSAGGDADTDPCPTPNSDAALDGVPHFGRAARYGGASPSADADAGTATLCAECNTNLFSHRHRIVVLERDLAWQKHCVALLVDTQQRAKRDTMGIFRDMLAENHTLKLGAGVPDHVADVERGRVVNMINGVKNQVDLQRERLDTEGQLRAAIVQRNRAAASHNAERKALQRQVGTLQNALAALTQSSEEEIATLRCRLVKLRRGTRVRELQAVAADARALRADLGALRSSVAELILTGPLSEDNVNEAITQLGDMAAGVPSPVMSSLMVSRAFDSTVPGFAASADGNLRLWPLGGGLAGGGGGSAGAPSVGPDTAIMRELCTSLANYWSNCEGNPQMLELSAELEAKMAEWGKPRPSSPLPPPPVTSPLSPISPKSPGVDSNSFAAANARGGGGGGGSQWSPAAEPLAASEAEHLRGAVYHIMTILSRAFTQVLGELDREQHRSLDLARHLASFKAQLRDSRDGRRPPHADAATECFVEEFDRSSHADSARYSQSNRALLNDQEEFDTTSRNGAGGARRTQHGASSINNNNSRQLSRRSSRRSSVNSSSVRSRPLSPYGSRADGNGRGGSVAGDDVLSNNSWPSRASGMSRSQRSVALSASARRLATSIATSRSGAAPASDARHGGRGGVAAAAGGARGRGARSASASGRGQAPPPTSRAAVSSARTARAPATTSTLTAAAVSAASRQPAGVPLSDSSMAVGQIDARSCSSVDVEEAPAPQRTGGHPRTARAPSATPATESRTNPRRAARK